MSIWDAPEVEPETADLWGQTDHNLIGDDVVQELHLPTTVYSGFYKSDGPTTRYFRAGTREMYSRLAVVKANLTRSRGYRKTPLETMLLKGTITWEIIED